MSTCIFLELSANALGSAGDPVVEPHAQRDQQVRLLYGETRIRHPVHTGHTDAQYVIVGEGADAEQCGDHGYLDLLRQLPDLVIRPREDDAVAGQYHRALRLIDGAHGASDLCRVPFQVGPVSRQIDLIGIFELGLLREDVLWDVHEDRAGPARARDVEGLFDGLRDLRRVHHQVVVLCYRQCDARCVGLLEGIGSYGGPRDLARDDHHRNRVHLRGRDAGHEVRGAGTGGRPRGRRGAPVTRGVPVRGVGRPLLVTHQDVAYLRVLGQCLVERENSAARKAEDHVHALFEQAFADYLSSR